MSSSARSASLGNALVRMVPRPPEQRIFQEESAGGDGMTFGPVFRSGHVDAGDGAYASSFTFLLPFLDAPVFEEHYGLAQATMTGYAMIRCCSAQRGAVGGELMVDLLYDPVTAVGQGGCCQR